MINYPLEIVVVGTFGFVIGYYLAQAWLLTWQAIIIVMLTFSKQDNY